MYQNSFQGNQMETGYCEMSHEDIYTITVHNEFRYERAYTDDGLDLYLSIMLTHSVPD